MTLTYPERVTSNNMQWLRTLVMAGSNKHPGANYWNRGSGPNATRKDLKYGDLKGIAQKLRVSRKLSLKLKIMINVVELYITLLFTHIFVLILF